MLLETLKGRERYVALARRYAGYSNFMYLGRGNLYPLAIEGALKLKEMSYVHAEGYAAGEFKHGPLSLIDDKMPVVALVPAGGLRDKMLGNIGDVRARGARVVAVAADGDAIDARPRLGCRSRPEGIWPHHPDFDGRAFATPRLPHRRRSRM